MPVQTVAPVMPVHTFNAVKRPGPNDLNDAGVSQAVLDADQLEDEEDDGFEGESDDDDVGRGRSGQDADFVEVQREGTRRGTRYR